MQLGPNNMPLIGSNRHSSFSPGGIKPTGVRKNPPLLESEPTVPGESVQLTPSSKEPVAEVVAKEAPSQPDKPVNLPQSRPALQSLGKGPLGGNLAQTSSGALVVFDEPIEQVESVGESRLGGWSPTGGIAKTGLESSLTAAFAGTGLPGLVKESFTEDEFKALNPGAYHNDQHPLHVGETVAGVAKAAGRSPERVRFLQQVALLHDADERVNTKTGDVGDTKTPASVHRTLEWMDKNRSALKERMGWQQENFNEAKALIARTDFPFDDKPRNSGTSYDGETPVQTYRKLLQDVPAEKRSQIMEDGLMLRFADQVGNYTSSHEKAEQFVLGLGQELRGVGVPVKDDQLLKDTPKFLASAGTDLDYDRQIASEMGVKPNLRDREQLMDLLPTQLRRNYSSNVSSFESR